MTYIDASGMDYRQLNAAIRDCSGDASVTDCYGQRFIGAGLEEGNFQPAGIISTFEDEEEQRQAAELFQTNLPMLETGQEREKAFHDILLSVKRNSYEYYTARLGTDMGALEQVIAGKKALEELAKAHISLE